MSDLDKCSKPDVQQWEFDSSSLCSLTFMRFSQLFPFNMLFPLEKCSGIELENGACILSNTKNSNSVRFQFLIVFSDLLMTSSTFSNLLKLKIVPITKMANCKHPRPATLTNDITVMPMFQELK